MRDIPATPAVTRDGWRWIVDAHREGRCYIVHSDELLTAFLELESAIRRLQRIGLTGQKVSS